MTIWTDARKLLLRQFWNAGLSATLISAEMPEFTRNAILGAAHRYKLTPRNTAFRKAAAIRPPRERKPRLEIILPKCEPVDEPLTPPTGPRVSILQLDHNTCRWPDEEIRPAEYKYCGAPPAFGRVYCPWHCSRAYTKHIRKTSEPKHYRQWQKSGVAL